MTKIINYKTGETIVEDENLSIRELVKKAVKNRISLAYADFTSAYADFRYKNLQNVDFSGADLEGADFCSADLTGASLRGADLEGADLRGVILVGADLRGADLSGADLRGAVINNSDQTTLLRALDVKII